MTPGLITQSEFARRHNVTRQAVNDWVKRRVLTLRNGLLDESEALAAIAAARDPVRDGKIALISGPDAVMTPEEIARPAAAAPGNGDLPTPAEAESFHAARTRHQIALAEREEIKLARERRELVPVSEITAALERVAARIAGILEAVPHRLAREMPHLSRDDLEAIERHLADARNACAEIGLEEPAEAAAP